MELKNCENCKVGRWYFETFGIVLCQEDCPYKCAKGESDV